MQFLPARATFFTLPSHALSNARKTDQNQVEPELLESCVAELSASEKLDGSAQGT